MYNIFVVTIHPNFIRQHFFTFSQTNNRKKMGLFNTQFELIKKVLITIKLSLRRL